MYNIMKIMVKLLKIIIINILVFLGLFIIADLTVISIYQLTHTKLFSDLDKTEENISVQLPNYKNIKWARKHFEECHEFQSEYVSYIGWRGLPYKGQTINVDEQGIRITPQSKFATEKSPLVVFLGGSTMWGVGSDDANTIPALFAQIANGRYRTMNLGELAYNAFQGYLFLRLQMINGLRPDIVVSYDGINDSSNLIPLVRPFSHSRENKIRALMKGQDRNENETLSLGHYLFNPLKSFIAKYKKNNVKYDTDETFEVGRKEAEKRAEVLLESWLCTKELAESHGAYFVAVLQPNPGVGKPYLKHLDLSLSIASCYKAYYSLVLKLLQTPEYQELNKHVLVLTDAFDLEEYIYIDCCCHVSPNGNKIIAEKIYNHINKFNDNKKKPLHLSNADPQF
jgi:hypothetical protein